MLTVWQNAASPIDYFWHLPRSKTKVCTALEGRIKKVRLTMRCSSYDSPRATLHVKQLRNITFAGLEYHFFNPMKFCPLYRWTFIGLVDCWIKRQRTSWKIWSFYGLLGTFEQHCDFRWYWWKYKQIKYFIFERHVAV